MRDKLISKKKPTFPISPFLADYLEEYSRSLKIPIFYDDLLRFSGSVAVMNKHDQDSLWVRVFYSDSDRIEIDEQLKQVYALLHSDGSAMTIPYLNVDCIDYCTFGNSKPFRVKIRNTLNDNFIYFYVKKADASRIYGLELEHMLSPHHLNFLVYQDTLIEEHIAGIPGDEFIEEFLPTCTKSERNQIAISFVKFNERCMIRLLGDMRSYNYVIVPTHDFDHVVYKIRAIDFDQQSFEGNLKIYRPQFFKENNQMVALVKEKLQANSIDQYKLEERSIVAKRFMSFEDRITELLNIAKEDTISLPEHVETLKSAIYKLTQDIDFKEAPNMGTVLDLALHFVKRNYENVSMRQIIEQRIKL